VAVNCWVVPTGMEALAGVTEIETNAAVATFRVVFLEIDPKAAEIVAVPVPALVASPFDPAPLLMIATPAGEEFHVTEEVMSCVLLSV
jgi:hypothetical protein